MGYMKDLYIDEHNAIAELESPKSYAILRYMPEIIKHLQTCVKCREHILGHMKAKK